MSKLSSGTSTLIGLAVCLGAIMVGIGSSPDYTQLNMPAPAEAYTASEKPPGIATPGLESGEAISREKSTTTHLVREEETLWDISVQHGIPIPELMSSNDISNNNSLKKGDLLEIPVYNIPLTSTSKPRYGELLCWWTAAQYLWPIGQDAIVIDFYTGVEWQMRRTTGAYHADVEPLAPQDTRKMKEVWGGEWSWDIRPVIVETNGRRIAASASAMPHDVEYITDNGVRGHFDIHFLNSTRHRDGLVNWRHQEDVLIAGGALQERPPDNPSNK